MEQQPAEMLTIRSPAITVHLPAFAGPLDLLLHLIERRQMEITAISLVAVIDQFLEYLAQMEEPPLEKMASFVAMAARLIYIKSQSLLPRPARLEPETAEEDPLTAAEELRQRLLEYKAIKEIARLLREREEAGLQSFPRATPPPGADQLATWTPPRLVGLSLDALTAAFRRVMESRAAAEPEPVPPLEVQVSDRIAVIMAALCERAIVTLDDLLQDICSRLAVVVTFIAVLELWRDDKITVTQEKRFGPVHIARGPAWVDAGPIAAMS
jgi:segregation and condensation protein A